MIEFDIEGKAADGENEEGDVGVHEPAENALTEGGGQLLDGLIGKVEGFLGAVKTVDDAAIEQLEQVGFIAGGEIDEMEVESFLLGP
jgi:hypothetical protein